MNHYETVFILNPVLSEEQIKEAVKKFATIITDKGGKFVNQEDWGLKKLAYPIQNKKSGFYHLFEYTVDGVAINPLEVEFRRDERVMRYLTVRLDKHAIAWADKRVKKIKANAKA
jgi:small subunit ribosomal protein S6